MVVVVTRHYNMYIALCGKFLNTALKMFVNNLKTTFANKNHGFNELFQGSLPGVTTTTMMLYVKILN